MDARCEETDRHDSGDGVNLAVVERGGTDVLRGGIVESAALWTWFLR